MMNKTGRDLPGIPTVNNKSHLGDLILKKYGDIIGGGVQDLEHFELIDGLEKPVMSFEIRGDEKLMLEVCEFLSQSPYAFSILMTDLPDQGRIMGDVYISRFPRIINFIRHHDRDIPRDLWGLIFGYPIPEIHQFEYDWNQWKKNFWPCLDERRRASCQP